MALLLLAAALLAACQAPGDGSGSPSSIPSFGPTEQLDPSLLPTFPAASGREQEITGVLIGESSGSCAYLRDADGGRWSVVYPAGWVVEGGESPRLIDPDGAVLAVAGDTITVRGAESSAMAGFCAGGTPFVAAEVVRP